MRKVFLAIALILLSAILLGGCFNPFPIASTTPLPSGATPAPTPTIGLQVEPQQLISKAEAEKLVGNALKDADTSQVNSIPSTGLKFCLYDSTVKDDRYLQISVYERTDAFNQDPKQIFDFMKSPAPRATKSSTPVIATVSGLGDEAFIADPGINIVYQGYYIVISVGDPNDAKNQEILKNAGQLAIDHLKSLLGLK